MPDGRSLRTWAGALADVVFPPACVHCAGLVETEPGATPHPYRHLCRRCAGLVDFVRAPHCATCGHPFFGAGEGGRQCVKCEGLDPAYGEGRTAVLFKGPVLKTES